MLHEHLALIQAFAPPESWVWNGFVFGLGFSAAELLRWIVGALRK